MTLISAREKFSEFNQKYTEWNGMCFPLSVDALLPHHELPHEWYEYFWHQNRSHGSWNQSISKLLKEFFGVNPQYNGHPIAKFTSFRGSPQEYMPDAPYGSAVLPDHIPLEEAANYRLLNLIEDGARRNNMVLPVIANEGGDHALALFRVTDLIMTETSYFPPSYALIDPEDMELGDHIYSSDELAGINAPRIEKPFAPLPFVERSNGGEPTATWEIIVLPSAPK